MVAGLNVRFDLWRIDWADDDYQGGAVVTGSVVAENLLGRLQAREEEQIVLQQGLETVKVFTVILQPGTGTIYERDELELVAPYDHPYMNDRFRILSMRWSDHNPRDPRNYLILQTSRSVRAHQQQ